jgi:hypothetical protein
VLAMTDNQERARRRRNIAIAFALGALVVLFYVMTIVRVHP